MDPFTVHFDRGHSSCYNQFDVTLTILLVQSEYEEYSYSRKIINPNDKGGYQFEQLQTKSNNYRTNSVRTD